VAESLKSRAAYASAMKNVFNLKKATKIQNKIFDFSNTKPRSGTWWWWFFLFFFNNPKNPEKPRQLMILWSTKRDREISCNDLNIILNHDLEKKSRGKIIDGAVAAWYFDGEKMHHNFVLEQTPLIFSKNSLRAAKSAIEVKGKKITVVVNKGIKFDLRLKEKNSFTMPTHDSKKMLGFNYELLRMNKLDLTGVVDGKKASGSSYFQRVFLNAPALPWYWGVFHFKKGTALTYFKIHSGRATGEIPLKRDVQFFYKGTLHRINKIKVRRTDKSGLPTFHVSGENKEKKFSFYVEAYSDSWWKFRKKIKGILPIKSTFLWHEYPAVIKKFEFIDKKTGKKVTEKDIGIGIGNAEHSFGILV